MSGVVWCGGPPPARSQVLLRTGFRGAGQSRALRFGEGREFATLEDAKAAAAAWLVAEQARQAAL